MHTVAGNNTNTWVTITTVITADTSRFNPFQFPLDWSWDTPRPPRHHAPLPLYKDLLKARTHHWEAHVRPVRRTFDS